MLKFQWILRPTRKLQWQTIPRNWMCTSGNINNPGAVVVIGAGNATGGAIARRFAKEGYTACVSRRNIEKLHPLVQTIEESGGKVIF